MVSGKAVVINEKGLHIKPAGKMSSIALSYPCMAYLVIREYQLFPKTAKLREMPDSYTRAADCLSADLLLPSERHPHPSIADQSHHKPLST